MTATNTIDHPVQAGRRGTVWFTFGHLMIVAADLSFIAVIAAAMLAPNNVARFAFIALGALLVLRLANRCPMLVFINKY
jgi:hypothetical protein